MEDITNETHAQSLKVLDSILEIKKILSEIEFKKNEILNLCSDFSTKTDQKNIQYAFSDLSDSMNDILDDMGFKHESIVSEFESDLNLKWEQSLRSDYYKSVL